MKALCKFNLKSLHGRLVFIKFFRKGCATERVKTALGLILILLAADSRAAFDKIALGAAPLAMGNAAVACSDFPYAVHYNPAAISVSGICDFAITYRNFFGLKEVSQADLVTNFCVAGRPVALGINRLGNENYTEFQGCLGIAFSIGSAFSLGVSFHLYHLHISGYGETQTWGLDGGLLVALLPELTLGAQMTNLNRPRIASNSEALPQVMTLGLCFEAIEDMQIMLDVCRDIHFGPAYRAGMSYRLTKGFTVRAGLEDAVDTVCTGCSFAVFNFCFEYALRIHQTLGLSHAVSMVINL